jgi:hypothetical protein
MRMASWKRVKKYIANFGQDNVLIVQKPNKPDSRFCAKCRMVLSYDAYEETVDNKQEKEDAIATLSDQLKKVIQEIEILKKQK